MMRNKAKKFPGPKGLNNPRAKTTALRTDGKLNMDPSEKLKENR